jgi:hypothetical protein
MAAAAPSPRRQCRSLAVARPCRSRTSSEPRLGSRSRSPSASASATRRRRARAPRSARAAGSRGGRCQPRASRRRFLQLLAGQRDRAALCGAAVRRDIQAGSRASDADQRHRALLRRSWDLLPIAQRDTGPDAYRRSRVLASGIAFRSRSRFATAMQKPTARLPHNRPSSLASVSRSDVVAPTCR